MDVFWPSMSSIAFRSGHLRPKSYPFEDSQVWHMDLSTGRRTLLGASDQYFAVDSTGLQAVRRGGAGLYLARQGSNTLLVPDGSSPAWSPNGKFLAYCSNNVSLCIRDMTTGRTNVASVLKSGSPSMPAWSPDSSKICFTSGAGEQIHILDLHSRLLRKCACRAVWPWLTPSWSFDGRYIAVSHPYSITMINTKTGGTRNLTGRLEKYLSASGGLVYAAFSPRRKELACVFQPKERFYGDNAPRKRLVVISLDW